MTHRLIRDGELLLYGYVGGSIRWTDDGIEETGFAAEDVIAALSEITGDITVRLNSAGGIAFDGIAIHSALKAHDGSVTIYIDALAGSAASVIAMAGDKVVMRTGSMLMVHNPAGITVGTAKDHRKTAADLDQVAEAAAEIYAAKSGRPTTEILEIMDAETWMRGSIAKSLGFADEVETSDAVMALPAFDYSLFQNAPAAVLSSPANRAVAAPGNPAAPAAHKKETVTMTTPAPAAPAPQIPASPVLEVTMRDATQDIFSRCRSARLTMEETNDVIVMAAGNVEKAKDAIINKLADRADAGPEIQSQMPARVTAEASDRFTEGATRALMLKAGLDGGEANEFSALTLREMARHYLSLRGDKKVYHDPLLMVSAAFAPVMATGMHSTSDFTNVLANVANKSMLKGWNEAAETFQRWTSKGVLTDFKPGKRVDLGLFPSLSVVPEGAEYSYATIGDRGETVQLATYGKLFAITRQAIINDDMGVFTRIPQRAGFAAIRTIGNLVYAVLTSNPNMGDGIPLFHASHGNLPTAAALATASLNLAKAAMAKQKDPEAHAAGGLNIRPSFLLVPVELESTANVLMASEFDPSQTQRVPNTARGMAEVVSDARLSAASATAWYLAGNPNQYDTIEVSYLNGIETPTLEQKEGWNVDGVEFKVRIDAAVKAIDFRALLKNAGQ